MEYVCGGSVEEWSVCECRGGVWGAVFMCGGWSVEEWSVCRCVYMCVYECECEVMVLGLQPLAHHVLDSSSPRCKLWLQEQSCLGGNYTFNDYDYT